MNKDDIEFEFECNNLKKINGVAAFDALFGLGSFKPKLNI